MVDISFWQSGAQTLCVWVKTVLTVISLWAVLLMLPDWFRFSYVITTPTASTSLITSNDLWVMQITTTTIRLYVLLIFVWLKRQAEKSPYIYLKSTKVMQVKSLNGCQEETIESYQAMWLVSHRCEDFVINSRIPPLWKICSDTPPLTPLCTPLWRWVN